MGQLPRLAVLLILGIAAQALADPVRYVVVDLGTLGGTLAEAYGINASGQVTGFSWTESGANGAAFLYSGGKMTNLGILDGSHSIGRGINASGQVVGDIYHEYTTGKQRAFFYADGAMSDLGTLGGSSSSASAINDAGAIVGGASIAGDTAYHAFVYRNGSFTDLGTLGGNGSVAYGINSPGQIVGTASLTTAVDTPNHAFLYENGVMTDLGTLGGKNSVAETLNASGTVVGYSIPAGADIGTYHAFAYDNGIMSDLGTLGGDTSGATAINASGQIVGYSETPGSAGGSVGFLYENGVMRNLNDLIPSDSGWYLGMARGINDSGEIVCIGIATNVTNDIGHAVLLKHVRPPTIVVIGKRKLRTHAGSVLVRGVTHGDVTRVTFRIGSGGSHRTEDINRWRFIAKKLKLGANVITVTAHGYNNLSATTTLVVTRK